MPYGGEDLLLYIISGSAPNYSGLPPASSVPEQYYWVSNEQGTAWLPGSLLGTYYNKGVYHSNGTTWEYQSTPYQATQTTVNAGVNNDQFVTSLTLRNSSQWATKENTISSGTTSQYWRGDKTFQDFATDVRGSALTGYVSGTGVITSADTVLSAIQKLNGNITALGTPVTSVSGTANRITSTGGSTPVIDIAATYVGQASINTVGTIGSGTWQGTPITDSYISSATTWNAKQNALIGTGFVKSIAGVISYDNSTYLTTSAATSTYMPFTGGTFTGPVVLNADASSALQPVTLQQLVSAVAGLYDLRGGYNASSNLFPTAGGSGTSGAINKADVFIITTPGTLGSTPVTNGDEIVALIDSPGQTASNWNIVSHDIGYTPVSNVLNSGNIFVGNVSNVAAGVTPSLSATGGAFSLSNTGIFTFPNADTATRGFVTSTDWNAFDQKNNLTSTFVGYGSAGGKITGTNTFTWDNTNSIFKTGSQASAGTTYGMQILPYSGAGKALLLGQYNGGTSIAFWYGNTPGTTNFALAIDTTTSVVTLNGTSQAIIAANGSNKVMFNITTTQFVNTNVVTIGNVLTVDPRTLTSGATPAFTFQTPANTLQTAGTETVGLLIDMATNAIQHAGNTTVFINRDTWFKGRQHNFATAGGGLVQDAFTAYFDAPIVGTNMSASSHLWTAGFNGKVAIGNSVFVGSLTTAPTAFMDVLGSTTTSSSVRIRSGSLPTTTSRLAGSINFNGTRYYGYKADNTTEETFAFLSDFPSGDATLVAGTIAVANTSITANAKIQLTAKGITGAGYIGYTINAGVGFTINSSSPGDVRTITWTIMSF